jgi:hypothetical protein
MRLVGVAHDDRMVVLEEARVTDKRVNRLRIVRTRLMITGSPGHRWSAEGRTTTMSQATQTS